MNASTSLRKNRRITHIIIMSSYTISWNVEACRSNFYFLFLQYSECYSVLFITEWKNANGMLTFTQILCDISSNISQNIVVLIFPIWRWNFVCPVCKILSYNSSCATYYNSITQYNKYSHILFLDFIVSMMLHVRFTKFPKNLFTDS